MSGFVVAGDSSGAITLVAPDVAGTNTVTLPAATGTAALTSDITTAINNNVIGVGQTWQNLTSSRSLGVTYTNSTGKPIMVLVEVSSDVIFTQFYVEINGIPVMFARNAMDSGTNGRGSVSLIIPNGDTYKFTGGTLAKWLELR